MGNHCVFGHGKIQKEKKNDQRYTTQPLEGLQGTSEGQRATGATRVPLDVWRHCSREAGVEGERKRFGELHLEYLNIGVQEDVHGEACMHKNQSIVETLLRIGFQKPKRW